MIDYLDGETYRLIFRFKKESHKVHILKWGDYRTFVLEENEKGKWIEPLSIDELLEYDRRRRDRWIC